MVGRLLSYWEGNFSGAMLNFGGVSCSKGTFFTNHPIEKETHLQNLHFWVPAVHFPGCTVTSFHEKDRGFRGLLVAIGRSAGRIKGKSWPRYIPTYTTYMGYIMVFRGSMV